MDKDFHFKEECRYDKIFYEQPCITLAKNLLGKTLIRKLETGEKLVGRIVETESYLGENDKASHSYGGKITQRNVAMFMKAGTAYVYTIYGMYYCFNISSMENGSAVLIRALEPLEGLTLMHELRKTNSKKLALKEKDLCNGPSKLCQAFQIDKRLNKIDLSVSPELWLENGIDIDDSNIVACERIGIKSAGEEWSNKPWRFYIKDNKFVSIRNKKAENIL